MYKIKKNTITYLLSDDIKHNFIFAVKTIWLTKDDGTRDLFPCIIIHNKETKIPIKYTGYEKYIIKYEDKGTYNIKKCKNVCVFLNYMFHYTNTEYINEVDIDILRNYLIYTSKKYTSNEWQRNKKEVFQFLSTYKKSNPYKMFKYNIEDLYEEVASTRKGKIIGIPKLRASDLGVKPPMGSKVKKNRVLLKNYKDLLLMEAKKYDPMLTLPLALQFYSGIREGEVVNLNYGRIREKHGAFRSLTAIELDLNSPAPHFKDWKGKTDPGSIKKFRFQNVYDDFLSETKTLIEMHLDLLERKGYEIDRLSPLFYDKNGKVMTVECYKKRVKQLFYNHFLPHLIISSKMMKTYLENAPYIETYEEEYPGLHMTRHWFTMYLITQAKLLPGEVQKWRGDDNPESMTDYISIYSGMIEDYTKISYRIHRALFEEISD